MSTPPLGFITPANRTQKQQDEHAAAVKTMPRFAVGPTPTLAKGDKVRLFDKWADPAVVADVGSVFSRFHQLTGSCVGAGGGNALFTLVAVQRVLNQTTAFLPWWPHAYGISRLLMGDRGPGEGSLGSTFAKALKDYGVFANTEKTLPAFDTSDGLTLTEKIEMAWSDGDSQLVSAFNNLAKQHPLGTAAAVSSFEEIQAAILNGYPCSFACNNYIGNASVQGSGADACVVGYWDGNGGHQQSIHAYWEHPTLGPLVWAQNNWAGNTYPKDPAGGPACGCWVTKKRVEDALREDAEVFAFSHLSWFPAQPAVLNWVA